MTWDEKLIRFIGETHRGISLTVVAFATGYAIAGDYGADKIVAAGVILGTLYGARTWENREATKNAAEVEKVKAAQPAANTVRVDA